MALGFFAEDTNTLMPLPLSWNFTPCIQAILWGKLGLGLTFYASILVYVIVAHCSWQSNCRLVIPMKKGNIFPQFRIMESGRLFRPANDQRKHFASLNGIVTILVCDDDVIRRVFVDEAFLG